MKRNACISASVLSAAVIFFGCGGGGRGTAPTPNPDTTAPEAPANLTAVAVSASQIDLSWSASTDNVGVKGYKVYRGQSERKYLTSLATNSTSDTGLSSSTEYCYAVSAYDEAGNESQLCNERCARTSWTVQFGTASDDSATDIAVDGSGNIYVTGYTYGGLDGSTNAGEADLFLIKYGSDGARQWTRQLGTPVKDISYSVAVDSGGNVYAAGSTFGGLDGNANANTSSNEPPTADLFVVKYDANGTKIWTEQTGTTSNDYAWGVVADGSGHIYAAGETLGGLDGNNAGLADLIVVKYGANGTKIWTEQRGTAVYDSAWSIAADGSDNIYVTGITFGSLDGNPNAGSADFFVARYGAAGTKRWMRQFGTASGDYAYDIAVDGNGYIYMTGYTYGSVEENSPNSDPTGKTTDFFVIKYGADGDIQWVRQFGSASNDIPRGIVIGGSGNIYVTGVTSGGLEGTTAGGDDVFVAKYDADGTMKWIKQLGTEADDEASSIAVYSDGSGEYVYVAGATKGGLDGNANAGGEDIFVVKYDAAGTMQ